MIRQFDVKKFFIGVVLILLGIVLPSFLTVKTFAINEFVLESIKTENSALMIVAGINLALLNSIRAFPHYLGAFIVGESIELKEKIPLSGLFKSIAVVTIIPMVYDIIRKVHHIRYDFGVPAIAMLIILVFLGSNVYNTVSLPKKSMLILFFLMAAQFLDIMPGASFLPVGRGEMSREVKLAARFLESEQTLNFISGIFCVLLLTMGVLLFFLIQDERRLRAMNLIKEKAERMEAEARIKALENRTNMEVKHLVHDLKSPLAAAQVLVGVVKESCDGAGMEKEKGYLELTEDSIQRLSSMISEILYDDYKGEVKVYDIISGVLAQISIAEYSQYIEVENTTRGQLAVYGNRIRLIRAIVNLLENSFFACEKSVPHIYLQVKEDGEQVQFCVRDNGKGIKAEHLEEIWNTGYSTRSSHGLGLTYVKSVVASCNGNIQVNSQSGVGTEIVLIIPKG